MSCIHVDDVAGMAMWAVENEIIRGALNAVLPHPVTNADFTRALARAVHRPAIFPVPSFALRLVLGRMASMLLSSARVRPAVAERGAYRFNCPDLAASIEAAL
jgi:NAD dependent epimerase/dehydratase family enzyme